MVTRSFAPEDVVGVVVLSGFLLRGLQIIHTRKDVARTVVFWTFGSPEATLEKISATGFSPIARGSDMPPRPFPFRLPFLIVVVPTLIGLALASTGWFSALPVADDRHNVYTTYLAAVVSIVALGLILPTPLRRVALRDDADPGSLQPGMGLVALIGIALLVQELVN